MEDDSADIEAAKPAVEVEHVEEKPLPVVEEDLYVPPVKKVEPVAKKYDSKKSLIE